MMVKQAQIQKATRIAKSMIDAEIMASLFMDNFDRSKEKTCGPVDRSLMGPKQAKYFSSADVNLTSSYEPGLWRSLYEDQVRNYAHLIVTAEKNGDQIVLTYEDSKPVSFDYYTTKNGLSVHVPEHSLF